MINAIVINAIVANPQIGRLLIKNAAPMRHEMAVPSELVELKRPKNATAIDSAPVVPTT